MKKYFRDLYKRKDLLVHLVVSGLKAQHRNTYLGYVWWILDPLLMALVFYFARVLIFGMRGEYIGAYLVVGLVAWKWITSVLIGSAKSISVKSGIITQVYLPKAIFPLGSVFTQMMNFTFSLAVIAIFLAAYRLVPTVYILWFPIVMFTQVIFLTAIALVLAYSCMLIRDFENVLTHITSFWFWTTPVIWETWRLPEQYQQLLRYNPAATLLISYRNILMYQTGPLVQDLLFISMISFAVIIYMLYFYNLNEHKIIRAI